MLIDARSAPPGSVVETDVCIVGAGAAGISLAREFTNSGLRVAMLESGGIFPEQATQNLYAGKNIGRPYWDPSDTQLRLRFFGGATNHWAGRCAVPDALDFEARDGVVHSGWPFALATLRPWYERAQSVCELGDYGYTPSDWGIESSDIPQPFGGPHFVCQALQNSPPTVFGKVYRTALDHAPRLSVYLNANALRFETADGDGDVKQLDVGTLPGGRFTVRAKIYVLATGAIENARMLLLSGQPGGSGLGNQHDLVGRYFMVHLEYSGGVIALANPFMDFKFRTAHLGQAFVLGGVTRRFESYICLSEETRRARKLPHLRFFFGAPPTLSKENDDDRVSVARMAKDLGPAMRDLYGFDANRHSGQPPLGTVRLQCTSEQMPNPDSRITLGDETDAFGSRTVQIDWRLTPDNKNGVAAAHRLFGAEIGRVGFGRLRSSVVDDDITWPADMYGDEHNMGTTRMNRNPRLGVVDENCRVHGVKNLYIAGSSVFPTAGAANPTLTIVALALRLADHIKERLS